MPIQKIISGGQTGADQGGLEAGEFLGIPTGGYMPAGFRTADGPRPDLAKRFNLLEHSSSGYPMRTRTNVRMSDLTICFGDISSPGSRLTRKYCGESKISFVLVKYPRDEKSHLGFIIEALKEISPQVINIAGNRESSNPGIQVFTRDVIIAALNVHNQNGA